MKMNNSSPFGYFLGKRKKSNKAFTLVELIVVITILAILGTIAFISLQGYSKKARDSVRITDLSNISKQLELMLIKAGQVYIPENKVDITASGTVVLYQGEMGIDTLNKLKVYNGGLDKINNAPYIYSTSKNLKQYELMGFLENGNQIASIITQTNAATDFKNRFPYVKGDNIGIFLDPLTKEPINNTGIGLDIVNATNTYTVYLDNSIKGNVTGTGQILNFVENSIGNCNSILKLGKSIGDGFYTINPTGNKSFEVYCDMTTNGGGWTKINDKLLGKEILNNVESTIVNTKSGSEIKIQTTLALCSSKKSSLIFLGDSIKWKNIKFTQDFYGGSSCWGIFGDSITNNSISLQQNLIPFNTANDSISNQIKMNTLIDNIFDGVTNRCDNSTTTNFWHSNKGNGLKSATVTLRKNDLNKKAGLFTDVFCNNINTKWTYKDIYIR